MMSVDVWRTIFIIYINPIHPVEFLQVASHIRLAATAEAFLSKYCINTFNQNPKKGFQNNFIFKAVKNLIRDASIQKSREKSIGRVSNDRKISPPAVILSEISEILEFMREILELV